jgi:hypothetical protein
LTMTSAPCRAISSAMALPIPLDDPVTSATFRLGVILSSFFSLRCGIM